MTGKVIVITGGSSGIGAAAARELRSRGATVCITGRSPKTAELAKEIGCDYFVADFARFRDVRELAGKLRDKYPKIDVLSNNVGAIVATRHVTEDGHEKSVQVNHLSGFLLTSLLRDRLESSGATVINTSSAAHHMGHIDWSNVENERHYNGLRAYSNGKLMNILHADEMNRRYKGVLGASFHPGVVATAFAREGSAFWRILYGKMLSKFMISSEKGADTLVWLATARPGPGYYKKRRPAHRTPESVDADLAKKLWDWSEQAIS